jgi:hypothetical protein
LTLFWFLVNISSLSKHVELSTMLQWPGISYAHDSRIEWRRSRLEKSKILVEVETAATRHPIPLCL